MITMLITSSVLLIAQVRVVPRQDLVHSVLWAIIVGLIAYLLYGIGLIPGTFWLHFATYPWGNGTCGLYCHAAAHFVVTIAVRIAI